MCNVTFYNLGVYKTYVGHLNRNQMFYYHFEQIKFYFIDPFRTLFVFSLSFPFVFFSLMNVNEKSLGFGQKMPI